MDSSAQLLVHALPRRHTRPQHKSVSCTSCTCTEGQINTKSYIFVHICTAQNTHPDTHSHAVLLTSFTNDLVERSVMTFWKSVLMPFVSEPPPAEHRRTGTQKKEQENKLGGREQHSPTERSMVTIRQSALRSPLTPVSMHLNQAPFSLNPSALN